MAICVDANGGAHQINSKNITRIGGSYKKVFCCQDLTTCTFLIDDTNWVYDAINNKKIFRCANDIVSVSEISFVDGVKYFFLDNKGFLWFDKILAKEFQWNSQFIMSVDQSYVAIKLLNNYLDHVSCAKICTYELGPRIILFLNDNNNLTMLQLRRDEPPISTEIPCEYDIKNFYIYGVHLLVQTDNEIHMIKDFCCSPMKKFSISNETLIFSHDTNITFFYYAPGFNSYFFAFFDTNNDVFVCNRTKHKNLSECEWSIMPNPSGSTYVEIEAMWGTNQLNGHGIGFTIYLIGSDNQLFITFVDEKTSSKKFCEESLLHNESLLFDQAVTFGNNKLSTKKIKSASFINEMNNF